MNAPIAAPDGSAVLPGTPPAAPQPLADLQGKTMQQIQEELRSGSRSPDDLLKELDDAEKAGLITSEPEQRQVAPSMAEALAAAAAQGQQPAASAQPPAPAAPGAPAQPPAAPAQKLSIEIDPTLLGHYYFDKDGKPVRTPAEAVQQLALGKQEIDRHVEFLSKERIPGIERERDAFRQDLEKERLAKAALEVEIEKLRTAPPATPAAPAAPAAAAPAQPEPEIKIPEVPAIPDMLTGDDVYDAEKVKGYNTQLRAHLDGLKSANEARTQILIREQNKSAEARFAAQEKTLKDMQDNFKAEIQKATTLQQQRNDQGNVSQQEQAAKAAADAEFKEIDTMVAGHKAIFGEKIRPVRDIENDNLDFIRNLAAANNVPGDIFETVQINNQPVVRIKSQVNELVALYKNPHLPAGVQLRQAMDSRAIRPPSDVAMLDRIYEIRRLRRERNLPYEDALYLLGRTNDALNESKLDSAKLQAQVAASAAQQAAAAGGQQFAREPAPGSGAPRFTIDDMPTADFYRIIRTPKEQRAPADVEILKRIEEAKGMRPGELTNV